MAASSTSEPHTIVQSWVPVDLALSLKAHARAEGCSLSSVVRDALEDFAGTGRFVALVASFGTLDRGGDVILPGSFRSSLRRWRRSKRRIPVIIQPELKVIRRGSKRLIAVAELERWCEENSERVL